MSITSTLLSLSTRLIPEGPVEEVERRVAELRQNLTGRVAGLQSDVRQGRGELTAKLLETTAGIAGQHWVVFGAAGRDVLADLGDRVELLGRLDLVDETDAALAEVRGRIASQELGNVRAVAAAAESFDPGGPVDVAALPYVMSGAADWFAAVDAAEAMLRPGGLVGAVDFYAARKASDPAGGRLAGLLQSLLGEGAYASADFAPYLQRRFETVSLEKRVADIPVVPVGVPYFQFVGRKQG